MIISHRHRFIFIKTGKVGGTSFEIALSKFLGAEDIVTPISKKDELTRYDLGFRTAQNYEKSFKEMSLNELRKTIKYQFYKFMSPQKKKFSLNKRLPRKFRGHIGSGDVRSLVGEEIWNSYYKFSIERNPWDRVVSQFHFQKNRPYRPDEAITDMSFREFVLGGYAYQPNFDLYCINGIPVLDKIMVYSRLEKELADLSEVLRLPSNLNDVMKDLNAKGGYRKSREYRSYYDEETKKTVAIQYAREISLFGFEF